MTAARYVAGASLLALSVVACGSDPPAKDTDEGLLGRARPDSSDAGAPSTESGAPCEATDFMILLDRTGTMAFAPSSEKPATVEGSKFALAISGIESLVTARVGKGAEERGLDSELRFGLMLFPALADGCKTVASFLATPDEAWTNAQCMAPETVVSPALGTAGEIAGALDPRKTPLCESTPLARALDSVKTALSPPSPSRKQYLILLTDAYEGTSFCDGKYTKAPVEVLDQLAAEGIQTVVMSLEPVQDENGIGERLNAFACAGRQAQDFESNCELTSAGGYRPKASASGKLYYPAATADEVAQYLARLAKTECCGCRADDDIDLGLK